MKRIPKSSTFGVLTVAAAAISVGAPGAAHAQAPANASASSAAAPGAYRPIPALRLQGMAASDVAARLSRTSGATVLVTGTVAMTPIALNTIGGSLETVLSQFVAALPKGTIIRAAFVPTPTNGAEPSGDAVSDYLNAIAAVQVPPSAKPGSGAFAFSATAPPAAAPAAPFAPGQWEVLGQTLPLDKALTATAGLGLKPVYLVSLPRPKADPVATMGQMQVDGMRLWSAMTPEQRTAAFQHQLSSLLNMPSSDRQAMLGQFMSQGVNMMKAMQALPPDQRNQLMADFKAAAESAGLPTGPKPQPPAP